ncbi:MAG: gamma-glutamyl-phosphate reductase, partial [Firmicutes bacterium]|nr:gamma-glutamyl-phosphate reductase [Bacillota bacterium]
MDYKETARSIKADSTKLGALSEDIRNSALCAIKKALIDNKEIIFAANREDMERGKQEDL